MDNTSITANGLLDPSMSMGLNGLTDWSPQHPFIDHFKLVRPWQGDGGVDGGASQRYTLEEMQANGWLDDAGWPVDLPEAVALTGYLAWANEDAFNYRAGNYRIEWEGDGDLTMRNVTIVDRGEGWMDIEVDRPANLWFSLRNSNADNPVRDITMVREDQVELFEAGAIFNPDWVELVDDLRMVRFMDWQDTNNSTQSEWADRPQVDDAFWDEAPAEVMVALGNQIGSDIWVSMPHLATDEYIREFATYVRDNLDPELKVHVEFSNEVWNFGFRQAQDSNIRGRAEIDSGDAWMQRYGMDVAETMQIWTEVFGDEADARMVRVLATQTTVTSRTLSALEAPDYAALNPDFAAPWQFVDAIAVATYFNGISDSRSDVRDDLMDWIVDSIAASTGPDDRYDLFVARAVDEIVNGAMTGGENSLDFVARNLASQRAIADQYGLDLISYEGGQHVNPQGPDARDPLMIEFMNALATSDEMGEIYETLFDIWYAADPDGPFMQFVDVANHGAHGAWGALTSLDGESARWDATSNENATREVNWEDRAETTFDHGITDTGTDGNDSLTGTVEEDFLLGRAGDDVLDGGDRNDGLHGGDGDDRLIGGGGDDNLFGGEGADVFVVGDGNDAILDFEQGRDVIDVSSILSERGFLSGDAVFVANGEDAVISFAGSDATVRVAGAADTLFTIDDFAFSQTRDLSVRNGVVDGSASANLDLDMVDDALTIEAEQGVRITSLNHWSDTGRELAADGTSDPVTTVSVQLRDAGASYQDIHAGLATGTEAGASYAIGVGEITATDYADQIIGRSTAMMIDAGAGDDFVRASTGDDVVVGGAGNDRLWGREGADTFVFRRDDGQDTIEDFKVGSDTIDLTALGVTDNDLQSILETGPNGNARIVSDGTQITLRGVSTDELSASDFALATSEDTALLFVQDSTGVRVDALNAWGVTAAELEIHANDVPENEVTGAYAISARDSGVGYHDINSQGVEAGEAAGASYHVGIREIVTGDGADFFRGRSDAVDVNTGGGNDYVIGGWNDDIINGGAGDDILFGGLGADTFVFDQNSGHDRVKDFEIGTDWLDIAAVTSAQASSPTWESIEGGILLSLTDDVSVRFDGLEETQIEADFWM